jgi:hypothetical protein
MVVAVSMLLVVAGVALAVWWAVTDRPQKAAGFGASALAILAGALGLLRGPMVEISSGNVSSIEAAAARASADADAIRDLRASVEAEAKRASGRVAANAAEARRLAAETSEALARVERRLTALGERPERRAESRLETGRSAPRAASPSRAGELGGGQLQVLATALRGSGSHEVTLTTSVDDPEAIELANRLKTAIEAGGWIVHGVNQTELEPTVSGLQVLAPVPLPAHVTTLIGALGRAGFQPKGMARNRVEKLEVLVGSKRGAS